MDEKKLEELAEKMGAAWDEYMVLRQSLIDETKKMLNQITNGIEEDEDYKNNQMFKKTVDRFISDINQDISYMETYRNKNDMAVYYKNAVTSLAALNRII